MLNTQLTTYIFGNVKVQENQNKFGLVFEKENCLQIKECLGDE